MRRFLYSGECFIVMECIKKKRFIRIEDEEVDCVMIFGVFRSSQWFCALITTKE